jgi:HPt (histidine-containing phosphotransfer) domain-containing protein
MDGYVTKPIRHELLVQALAECQRAQTAARDVGGPVPANNSGSSKPADAEARVESQFDTKDLVERLMGDKDLAKQLAGVFVDRMPGQLASLADAIGNADAQAATLAAHSIKGMAANMGCPALRDLASTVESLSESGALARASEVLPEFTGAFDAVKPAIEHFCSRN